MVETIVSVVTLIIISAIVITPTVLLGLFIWDKIKGEKL